MGQQLLEAFIWSTAAIIFSQGISISLMWWLGLPPKKLIHEIEDVQNTAVGACFFIVAITVALFIGVYTSNGYSEVETFANSALWFISGLAMATIQVSVLFALAHRIMGRIDNESIYGYMRREIVQEQNAAIALFLGGLSIPPFIAVVFQII